MKDESLGQIKTRGFSTIELLIATAITTLVLSAVVLVSFGGQSLLAENAAAADAMNKAKDLLEETQTTARKDFRLINPIPETTEGIYTSDVEVTTLPDFFTKIVTAKVNWRGAHGQDLNVTLDTVVTNFTAVNGGFTCDSVLTGNWASPQYSSYNFGGELLVPPDALDKYPITDMDIFQNKAYVTVNNADANTAPTFSIFDVSDPTEKPLFLGSLDNASTVSSGLNAVHAIKNYAYVASAYGANFDTCLQGANCSQLQVINISDSANPSVAANFKVPGVGGSGGQAIGKSIFYRGGYIYLGLAKTGSGPEFNILDVSDPVLPKLIGNYSVGNGVNALYVKGKYAYLATPNDEELTILDIGDPANPTKVGGFDAPGGSGNGKTVDVVGNTLYLGRTLGGNEFFILDNSNPASSLPELGSHDFGSESLRGLIVRDYLTFLLTSTKLHTSNTSNPASLSAHAPAFLLTNVAANAAGTALDCEGNYLYFSSEDSAGKGYITQVKPGL